MDAAGGLETAGYCRTHHWRGGFANSAGQALAAERADVGMAGIARRDGFDGAARQASGRLADIDGAVLGARAAAKSNAAIDPIELPPDRYEVVLEPSAVADLLEALSYYGFNAKAVAEQRSFVRLGDDQFDPALTLFDDAATAGVAVGCRRHADAPRPARRPTGRRSVSPTTGGLRPSPGPARPATASARCRSAPSPATSSSPVPAAAPQRPRSTARSSTRPPPTSSPVSNEACS